MDWVPVDCASTDFMVAGGGAGFPGCGSPRVPPLMRPAGVPRSGGRNKSSGEASCGAVGAGLGGGLCWAAAPGVTETATSAASDKPTHPPIVIRMTVSPIHRYKSS